MVTRFRGSLIVGLTLLLALPIVAKAQDIDIGTGGADLIWKGVEPGARAGVWLDQGAVGGNDSRRDLIVGAPGNATIPGAVYVISGGPTRTGELLLSSADCRITSSEAGNLFGLSTAAGNVTNTEGSLPRNLLVGAPGSLGGRGSVYLFTGGFASGSALTDANARLRIIGAPGDQLGTALATGDLDNDHFREIIIGAPGTNRVYVIRGGSGLSGTIDLSVTPAQQTINAPGLGRVLAAGDVTNDGIADLVVGSPSSNLAYLFAGGALPLGVPGTFFGIDAADAAGTALRILDLDGDGDRELVISAPRADGPGNSRVDGGEVYVFTGPVAPTGGRSLAQASITFYGPAAGHRLGEEISSGDINRDLPNDLVMLAPGSGSAGRLTAYYGRSLTRIGVASGAGRVVDFATTGQASRHIIGSSAVGAIATSQVFEVTGEGARDIIVGVPSADSQSGKLYFTISPKLRLSTATIRLVVNRNTTGSSATAVTVANPSTVPIGWAVTSNQPWLTTSTVSGIVDHTHPATFRIVGNAVGRAPGVYTGRVHVASTSPDLEMSLPVDVTMTVTGTRISIDAPAHGASVTGSAVLAGWAADTAPRHPRRGPATARRTVSRTCRQIRCGGPIDPCTTG